MRIDLMPCDAFRRNPTHQNLNQIASLNVGCALQDSFDYNGFGYYLRVVRIFRGG